MSKMGRLAQEQQERERARAASIYEAEIESLIEEIEKLKKRLKLIEDSNLIIKDGQIYSPNLKGTTGDVYPNFDTIFTRVIAGNTMTVSRPREDENHIPLSLYVAIDKFEKENLENGDLIYAAYSKKALENFRGLHDKTIFKVKEIYEANGDV